MALNFASIATKKFEEIERAPLPPSGTYRFVVSKLPEVRDQGQWDVVDFTGTAVEAMVVDPEALDAYLSGNQANIKKIVLRKSFMFDKQDAVAFQATENNLKRFLIDHLKCADESMSIKEGLNASLNCPFIGTVVHKQDKEDKEVFHANLTKTAPID